jgi:histone deacetylase 1/2
MRQPDRENLIQAVIKELNDHIERKHWELILREDVPDGTKVLDSVWSIKRKREIATGKVYKWKARLNVHGGQQEYGVNYFETYSPIVQWFTVRMVMVMAIVNKWATRQVDFILAYPQADIEFDIYMELPQGVETKYGNGKTHVLKLKKNLYGQKQAGRVWNKHLTKGLTKIGFKPSKIDECIWYRDKTLFLFYVDDGIFVSPKASDIDTAIADLQAAKYNLEDQGKITDYLGINFEYLEGGRIKLSQPLLIEQIINDVRVPRTAKTRTTPALSSRILQRWQAAPAFDNRFNYRSVVGKLNFLEKGTRPDIAYATHQVARFSSDPKRQHGEAIEHLCKYLSATKHDGVILDPNYEKSLEVYADADWSGNWYKRTAQDDPSTAKSRTGYVVMFGNCPIVWASKLQSLCSLSSCEAEYVALSTALRAVIPLIQLLQEFHENGIATISDVPKVFCKAFEDNSGALEMAKVPKLRPRTKHLNLAYHHFRDWVRDSKVLIYSIKSEDQIADVLTKPLPQNSFLKHRKQLLGYGATIARKFYRKVNPPIQQSEGV